MRKQIRTVTATLFVGLLLGAVTVAKAASVGVSFAGRDPGFALDADASAGVVAQPFWNNIAGEPYSSTSYPLLANTGEFTDVKLVYAANDSWHSDGPSVTANDKLMKGIQKMNPDPDGGPIVNGSDRMIFTITNLPAGTFNVLVYLGNNGLGGEVSVNVGATTYYVSEEASFTGTFTRSTDTTAGVYPVGANYAQFDAVASVGGAITVTVIKNIVVPQVADGGGVAAIQFVQLTGSPLPSNTTACSITTPPASVTNIAGDTATFSVVATSPSRIQWQKNGADIPGAVNPTYKTPPTVVGDNNATFRAIVYNNVNTNISANAVLTVLAGLPPVLTQGFLEVQRWDAVTGVTLDEALAVINAAPPVVPTTSFFVGSAAVPDQAVDNYAIKMSGWFSPSVSGDYNFFIRSDDASALYLNEVAAVSGTNALPDLISGSPIAREDDCCDAFIEPDLLDPATTATPIPLVAGKLYGMTVVLKEGTGGDLVQVAWRLTTDTTAAATLTPIGGQNIYTVTSPSGKTAVITTQPTPVTTIEGQTATFNVVVTTTPTAGAASIQWLKNGTPIPGATAASYTTPILTLADNGAKYKASILTLVGPLTSDEVTLTVNLDNVPPVALKAGAIKNLASGDDVGIIFSEKLAQPLAETIANYTIAGGTVSSASYMASSPGVILRVTGLSAGAHSVNVKNLTDVKGNPMTPQDLPFTVSATPVWGAVGGDEMGNGFPKGYGVLPVGNGGFDVYSEGIGEWASYDEATFVYEQITGDFDKKLRVEFQDTASQWSRAGLIMREVTNVGVDRATQEAGAAGRYQKIHVNPTGPTMTGPGTAGNNSHEGNRRLDKGLATTAPAFANNTTPLYPTAWVRLQRIGQTNNLFRSDDGIAWSYLGQTVWDIDSTVDGALANTVFVGPEYSPENGNVTVVTDRARWLAQFRDYGNTFPSYPPVAKRDYSIGMNFGADNLAGGLEAFLDATEVAGIPGIAQKNWNNMDTAAASKANLVADKNGVAENTTATVTWNSPNLWTSEGNGEINNVLTNYPDHKLMQSYLDTGDSTTTTVKIENIPPNLTTNAGGYDVYVYFMGGIPGRAGAYRVVNGTDTNAVVKDYVYARGQARVPFYQPVQENTSSTNYGAGNYLVFRGLTAANIQVEATTVGTTGNIRGVGAPRAPINAIQLVTPGTGSAASNPTISISTVAGVTRITFTGRLTSSATVNGSYTDVPGATSPYTVTTGTGSAFYRSAQ